MPLRVSPERTEHPGSSIYERLTYGILLDDTLVGDVVIDRVKMRRDLDHVLSLTHDRPILSGALQAAAAASWGPLSVVDYVKSLRILPEHQGSGFGAQALSDIPSPSGSWQVLLPYPLAPADGVAASRFELEGLRRYWMRAGFRSTCEESTSTFMVRNSA